MESILYLLLLLGNFFVFGYGGCPEITNSTERSELPTAPNPVKLSVPVEAVIVHQKVSSVYTNNTDSCKEAVLEIQKNKTRSGKHSGIFYNFLVCEDGEVYEGLGWDEAVPRSHGKNKNSLTICLIGDFKDHEPTKATWDAFQQLIVCGVEKEKIKKTSKVISYPKKGSKQNKLFQKIRNLGKRVTVANILAPAVETA